jgi:hypothetical protein
MRNDESSMKGDERILGQGDFVETVLKAAQENLDRKYRIRALGCDFDWLVDRVLGIFGLSFKELLTGGKQRKMVQARSVLCYWGTRELGMSAVSISKKLNIASSTGSESAVRGRQIVEEHELKLLEEDKSENPSITSPNTPGHRFRNRWPASSGIGGRNRAEYAVIKGCRLFDNRTEWIDDLVDASHAGNPDSNPGGIILLRIQLRRTGHMLRLQLRMASQKKSRSFAALFLRARLPRLIPKTIGIFKSCTKS